MLQLKTLAARAIRAPLARYGFELHRRGVAPNWQLTAELLRRYKVEPRTVFDIGVAEGTPWLYEIFPNCDYHLIDPTRESLPHMQAIARRLNATIHNIALGEQEGEIEVIVRSDDIGASSLFQEVGEVPVSARYIVPVRRFDHLIEGFARPALAKIDVQGAELMVLKGMGEQLHNLDVVIIETSTVATLENGPEFRDVFHELDSHEFILYDIISLNRRPLDGAIAQIDAVFVPRHSPLRSDKRWALSRL